MNDLLKANDCFFSMAVKHTRQTNWASNLEVLAVLHWLSWSQPLQAEVDSDRSNAAEKVLCYSFRVYIVYILGEQIHICSPKIYKVTNLTVVYEI